MHVFSHGRKLFLERRVRKWVVGEFRRVDEEDG